MKADYEVSQEFLRRLGHRVALVARKPVDPNGKSKMVIWPVDQEDAADQACGLSDDYYSVYCNLNPFEPYLLNSTPVEEWRSVSDAMIATRTRLLIDVDGHNVPKELARQQKDEIKAELGPPLIETDSGNGYGLIYPYQLPNDEQTKLKARAFLAKLKARWTCVDTSVYSAGQLTRVIGTLNRSTVGGSRIPTYLLNS